MKSPKTAENCFIQLLEILASIEKYLGNNAASIEKYLGNNAFGDYNHKTKIIKIIKNEIILFITK